MKHYYAATVYGVNQEYLIVESQRLLALHFYREHILSLGQAARLASMNYWSFTEFLCRNNVPIVDLDNEELASEYSTVKRNSRLMSTSPKQTHQIILRHKRWQVVFRKGAKQ